jgi:hypothetical protein
MKFFMALHITSDCGIIDNSGGQVLHTSSEMSLNSLLMMLKVGQKKRKWGIDSIGSPQLQEGYLTNPNLCWWAFSKQWPVRI